MTPQASTAQLNFFECLRIRISFQQWNPLLRASKNKQLNQRKLIPSISFNGNYILDVWTQGENWLFHFLCLFLLDLWEHGFFLRMRFAWFVGAVVVPLGIPNILLSLLVHCIFSKKRGGGVGDRLDGLWGKAEIVNQDISSNWCERLRRVKQNAFVIIFSGSQRPSRFNFCSKLSQRGNMFLLPCYCLKTFSQIFCSVYIYLHWTWPLMFKSMSAGSKQKADVQISQAALQLRTWCDKITPSRSSTRCMH